MDKGIYYGSLQYGYLIAPKKKKMLFVVNY